MLKEKNDRFRVNKLIRICETIFFNNLERKYGVSNSGRIGRNLTHYPLGYWTACSKPVIGIECGNVRVGRLISSLN